MRVGSGGLQVLENGTVFQNHRADLKRAGLVGIGAEICAVKSPESVAAFHFQMEVGDLDGVGVKGGLGEDVFE